MSVKKTFRGTYFGIFTDQLKMHLMINYDE